MSQFARLKTLVGTGDSLPVLEQVATPRLRDGYNVYTVTGTTAITGLSTEIPIRPGRQVTLIGTHATGPAITDTAIGSAVEGTISLSAALTLASGSVVTLIQNNEGAWLEMSRAANS